MGHDPDKSRQCALALGERESGTARLEEAVAAYRDALQERTRARVPLEWAMTQINLGDALLTLGERESGTARLEEAVAAYRDALQENTRARVPLDWAITQTISPWFIAPYSTRTTGHVISTRRSKLPMGLSKNFASQGGILHRQGRAPARRNPGDERQIIATPPRPPVPK